MESTIRGFAGERLFEALLREGLPVDSPCGGAGRCGKCRVHAVSEDLAFSPDAGATPVPVLGEVTACRTWFARAGTAKIRTGAGTMRIVEDSCLPVPAGEPALVVLGIALPEPVLGETVAELDSLLRAAGRTDDDRPGDSLALARRLPGLLRGAETGRELGLLVQDGGRLSLPSRENGPALVAAVDIGTTTVAVRVLDAATGSVIASGAQANVQRWAGADVIARIGACASPRTFDRLARGISGQVSHLLATLVEGAGRSRASVHRIAVAGNPTMLHILAGVDPSGIACAPFVPVFSNAFDLAPSESPLEPLFGPDCRTILLPGVSAYVGSDLVAGALACGLGAGRRKDETVLLVDLGTNGEIMLFSGGRTWCTSTAAGPAFEGAAIRFGSPSVPGAIDHVRSAGGFLETEVIGGGEASGICGSGILDAVAVLVRTGAVDETGRIVPACPTRSGNGPDRPLDPSVFGELDGKPAVILDRKSGVMLTQDDLRQVQLAKAAVAAGTSILLARASVAADDVDLVYLAGGFGSRLDPESALDSGLLHRDFSGRIEAVGNAALAGASIAALRAGALGTCSRIARECEALELSGRADFVEAFSEAMFFPDPAERPRGIQSGSGGSARRPPAGEPAR